MAPPPEAQARQDIDRMLAASGWAVQDRKDTNLHAGDGVAIREFPLPGHGFADYLLYVERKAVGVVEAKPAGTTLSGVELQARQYGEAFPAEVPAHVRPLPFLYQSTGVETRFTNRIDPEPRSRRVFSFHRPETLRGWIAGAPEALQWVSRPGARPPLIVTPIRAVYGIGSANVRSGLLGLPPLPEAGLWPAQVRAIRNLERSLQENRPRALIQMATGSGKTFTAVNAIYRLIKDAGARRVLFLVDRFNLGRQAKGEFDGFVPPGSNRSFTSEFNVQHLASNKLDDVARVTISTIQRLYSILQDEEDLDEEADESSTSTLAVKEPVPVVYNPTLPPEYFDVVFIDECHRSIYTLWKQVLDYFDAFLVGLTATPSKQTFGFFDQNLVMEYGHQHAVADHVNVDYDVYRIRTRISREGATVESDYYVERRDRETRSTRWEKLDEDLTYEARQLDRSVVARDQIRTIVRAFRERLFTEIFPGRSEVPKTLVFAKSDAHAEDIVEIIRQEFGRGNDFCRKITYRTSGRKPDELIRDFRNDYLPRIAVTVDMVATGTDIKPLEIVLFMRDVKSRVLFEQMKGRGVRVITPDDLKAVTGDAESKSRFVIVDAVGVTEREEFNDSPPLNRNPTVSTKKLLEAVAQGVTHPDAVSTLAGRLARLDLQLDLGEKDAVKRMAGGLSLQRITAAIVEAVDPDIQADAARERFGITSSDEPGEEQLGAVREDLIGDAVAPLASSPELRKLILDLKASKEQTIDDVTKDEVLGAGWDPQAAENAKALVRSFEEYIEKHKDEIAALRVLLGSDSGRRPGYDDIEELAEIIEAPPRQWTTERLWKAYETLDRAKVRGRPEKILTNIVSLIRYAAHREEVLEPFPRHARANFENWMEEQRTAGVEFNDEQRWWLEEIFDYVAANLEIGREDFEYPPFAQKGGFAGARRVFGDGLKRILEDVMEVVAA